MCQTLNTNFILFLSVFLILCDANFWKKFSWTIRKPNFFRINYFYLKCLLRRNNNSVMIRFVLIWFDDLTLVMIKKGIAIRNYWTYVLSYVRKKLIIIYLLEINGCASFCHTFTRIFTPTYIYVYPSIILSSWICNRIISYSFNCTVSSINEIFMCS